VEGDAGKRGGMRGSSGCNSLVSPERLEEQTNHSPTRHPAAASLILTSFAPPSKLARLLFSPRLCSRALLRTKPHPRAPYSCFSTLLSTPRALQPAPRPQFQRPRPSITPIAAQIRFCSVDSNTSFAIMASDRDVLPSE
jgi:hypothetical protein